MAAMLRETGCCRMSSQGWSHGGSGLDGKEQATGRAGVSAVHPEETGSGCRVVRGNPGDEAGGAGQDCHAGPREGVDCVLRTVEVLRGFSPGG